MNGSPEEVGALLAGLERDASELSEELARLTAACQKAEADAMAAVENGNDAIARECLMRQDRLSESAAVVERQLAMQQTFIATSRELLASVTPAEGATASVTSPDAGETDVDEDALMKRVAEIQQELSAALPPADEEKQ